MLSVHTGSARGGPESVPTKNVNPEQWFKNVTFFTRLGSIHTTRPVNTVAL